MEKTQIKNLLEVVHRLRAPDGCPWDREQTIESMRSCLIEETYEVVDAMDSGDRTALCEELGDLLLQVVFQAQIADEEGAFNFDDVAKGIADKLVRRHPHVFGDVQADTSDQVLKNWEKIKKTEKGGEKPRSLVDGIPRHLPALSKAHLVQKRVAKVGFEWDEISGVVDKLEEELAEVKEAMAQKDAGAIREELGDLLFSTVNLNRYLGHESEELLNENITKFMRRFQGLENRLHAEERELEDCSIDELEAVWQAVKRDEKAS
ncbi:nucleoside triphosphate pyrophosphohydrolase [Tichowtungia aerotolerans]|uniref:Nucleoside triphosphate pyrophosphohydrolase n=1 Tax=Tichowtungia aerotolerans TaxID=2697043 RepID=A0A6P1MBQ9_9BACT|nr:nucleoside triphosphate pyrophosphohydrolase [Tichowtungia aerotolerans]QHI69528.1 nucleoside triphosphate pyrophosphohydrolase [Tichowtungia aerotolerans]